MLSKIKSSLFAFSLLCFGFLAGPVHAAGQFDVLTTSVTFVDVVAAVMAVAAVLSGLYVTMRGVRMILTFIRRG